MWPHWILAMTAAGLLACSEHQAPATPDAAPPAPTGVRVDQDALRADSVLVADDGLGGIYVHWADIDLPRLRHRVQRIGPSGDTLWPEPIEVGETFLVDNPVKLLGSNVHGLYLQLTIPTAPADTRCILVSPDSDVSDIACSETSLPRADAAVSSDGSLYLNHREADELRRITLDSQVVFSKSTQDLLGAKAAANAGQLWKLASRPAEGTFAIWQPCFPNEPSCAGLPNIVASIDSSGIAEWTTELPKPAGTLGQPNQLIATSDQSAVARFFDGSNRTRLAFVSELEVAEVGLPSPDSEVTLLALGQVVVQSYREFTDEIVLTSYDQSGDLLWGPKRLQGPITPVDSPSGRLATPDVFADGVGGLIVFMGSFAYRLDSSGSVLWSKDESVLNPDLHIVATARAATGDGGSTIAYVYQSLCSPEQNNVCDTHLYVERVQPDGSVGW